MAKLEKGMVRIAGLGAGQAGQPPRAQKLSRFIPPSNFNCSSITLFKVIENQIGGTLPKDLGITQLNLKYFNIGANRFTRTILSSISNASNLQFLIIVQNEFKGKVPNLENLGELEWLSISDNRLRTPMRSAEANGSQQRFGYGHIMNGVEGFK
ncbi:hypothetical protein LguiB_029260 [Lonicera macranthoides]